MGAPSSVKLANITLYKHLQHTFPLNKGILPILQLRLIDDIFGIFNGTLEQLKSCILLLNNSHPTIKFTIDSSPTHIPFPDTLVYLVNNKLHICSYKNQQILNNSFTSAVNIRIIPKEQFHTPKPYITKGLFRTH